MTADEPQLMPVEPGYKNVLRAQLSLVWLVLTVAASIAGGVLLERSALAALLPLGVAAAALLVVIIVPERIHRRLRYGIGERLLQVARGWLFHTDTIVPFVRVQHLDVVRGPLDKMFGTATLVVHTAGTHNSVVTVPGLAPARAAEMRDIIRGHVRSDLD